MAFTLESIDQVDTASLIAGVGGTLIDINVAVDPSPADVTDTCVLVDAVDTFTMLTWA